MGFTRRTLVADCEISTGKLTVSQLPPIFVGEAGALDVNITLKLNGQAYSPTGVTASMHLYWPGTTLQSEYVQMTVNGNVVSGRFTNLLTALPGSPLLIIRIKEASTNDIIVATATPIRIWQTRGESIVNPTPGPKSSIKSVDGQEPDETGNIVLYDSHIPSDVITGQNTVALALAYLNTYKANAADVYTKLEVYNKAEIETLISTLFRYKGNKATYAEIEAITTKAIGDVWFCLADSSEYAWDGSKWEKLGPIIDLSAYLTQFSIAGLTIDADHTTITAAQLRTALDIYTKTEVDTALATKADKTIEINGHNLSADFDISAHEITADGIGDKTVAGNPLVVEDAIEATAKKVVVGLEPIQDLHGYDAPWPAGGGENLLDPNIKFPTGEQYGLMLTSAGGYTFSFTGTATSSGNILSSDVNLANAVILPAGTYISKNGTLSLYKTDGTWLRNQYSGYVFTIDEPFWVKNIYWQIVEGRTYNINSFLALVKGSTAPTEWTPYSNICPISGRTGVNVTRTGKNLYNKDSHPFESYAGRTDVGWTPPIFTKSGTYTFSCNSGFGRCYITVYSTYNDAVQNINRINQFNFPSTGKFTVTFAEDVYLRYQQNDITGSFADVSNSWLTNFGDSKTDYAPYQGVTIPITFPQSAGTVYGGELTINQDGTGELVVDRAEVDLGMLNWLFNSTYNFFNTVVNGKASGVINIISSVYPLGSVWSSNADYVMAGNGSNNNVYVKDSRYTDASEFKTAMSGVQLVYKIATPITYTLTATQVQLLEAYNCLFTDGNSLSLTYLGSEASNVQAEIDEFERVTNNILASIAPVETSTASASHAIGSYIMLNNQFCKVTTAIAAGETIAIGRNVTKTTLAQELLAIINS